MYVAAKGLRQGYKLGLNWEGLTVTEVKNLDPLPGNTSGGDLRTPTTTFKATGIKDGVTYQLEAMMFQDSAVWVEDAEPEPEPDFHSAMIKDLREANERWPNSGFADHAMSGFPTAKAIHQLRLFMIDLMNLADEQQRTIDTLMGHRHRISSADVHNAKTSPPLREDR